MSIYFYERDNSVNFSQIILVVLVVILPFFGGCGEDDNPDAPIHANVDGFILEVGEVEVYRQFQGTHSGSLTVGVGEEIEVHVVFLDDHEDETQLPEVDTVDEHGHEEEFALDITGYDETIIAIHLDHGEHGEEDQGEHGEEDQGEHGEEDQDEEEHSDALPFGLEGLKAGTTEIKLQLLHGDHPDFTAALLIPVTVQ